MLRPYAGLFIMQKRTQRLRPYDIFPHLAILKGRLDQQHITCN